MDFNTFDRLLPILRQQAMVNGSVFLLVSLLFAVVGVGGVYVLRAFFQSKNKKEDNWFAFSGTALILVGIAGFLVFLSLGLPRLLNPTFYGLEQYFDFLKAAKGVYQP